MVTGPLAGFMQWGTGRGTDEVRAGGVGTDRPGGPGPVPAAPKWI